MGTPTPSRVHLIVARARNGVIGKDGAMPWHLPEDLAHFKRTTLGHCIIMGRKTWDSLGRALPGRRNIVVTRNSHWHGAGAEVAHSLDDAVRACGAQLAFVIGGAQLYRQALDLPLQALHLTQIDADFAGDTFFPAPDPARWRERSRQHLDASAQRPYGLDFIEYESISGAHPEPSGENRNVW